jgi:hypothetical protein
MHISLSKFANRYNLARTTVWNWCKAQNIDTRNGLDEDAVQRLKDHFKLDVQPEVTIIDERPNAQPITLAPGVFNLAQRLGMTDSTRQIEALNQLKNMAYTLKSEVQNLALVNRDQYLETAAAARAAKEGLDELQETIQSVKTQSEIIETLQLEKLQETLSAKAKMDQLRGGQ